MTPLWVRVRAGPENVRALRARLRAWLGDTVDDPDLVEDLLLAVSEAVENVVDHAFVGMSPGTITMEACHDPTVPSVIVVVADDGHWQEPSDPGHRGRGLGLIARLCTQHDLDIGAHGTRVTMRRRVAPRVRGASGSR